MPASLDKIAAEIAELTAKLNSAIATDNSREFERIQGRLDGLKSVLADLSGTSFEPISTVASFEAPPPDADISPEQRMVTEPLPENAARMDAYFGDFFALMRQSLLAGGSEFGVGLTLFSLAVSIRAAHIIEIGRFKGFSTLCLASALRFLDIGWREPAHHKQRPNIDYAKFEEKKRRVLRSIDPYPTVEATQLIEQAQLKDYVDFINVRSDDITPQPRDFDLIFIDGDHTYEGCIADVVRYVPAVRPGGYFVLHDYFGWFDEKGINNSPIKRVVDELVATGQFQQILIDTGYPSFVIFRTPVA